MFRLHDTIIKLIPVCMICFAGIPVNAQNQLPAGWSCDEEFFQDGICDCGCNAIDRDCQPGTFEICERDGCAPGTVPWEHQPYTCMRSACGDGWADIANGEVCDDGDALRGGGCNADCSAVNVGWTCGEAAEGCQRDTASADAGVDREMDAESNDSTDAATTDETEPDTEATSSPNGDAGQNTGSPDSNGGLSPIDDTADEDTSDSGCSTSTRRMPIMLCLLMLIGGGIVRRWASHR